jgi:hypothetical protein
MDLKDLKSAWENYSSQELDKHRLEKEDIRHLLETKSKSLVERINRNIRIGLGILLLFVIYTIVDSLFFTDIPKSVVNQPVEIPGWIVPIDFFSSALIIFTYLFFVFRFVKIKRSFSIDLQLSDLLKGILDTLKMYRRLFYMAVAILLINITIGFIAGYCIGIKINADNVHVAVSNLDTLKIISVIGIGLVFLALIVGFTFFVLHWGFKKLYGKYIESLQNMLEELREPKIAE